MTSRHMVPSIFGQRACFGGPPKSSSDGLYAYK